MQCMPQCWPMKPSDAHSPRPREWPARQQASQCPRAAQPAEGATGDETRRPRAEAARHGEGEGQRKPKRPSDPHAASPSQALPLESTQPRPSSPKHAPRDSAPPTCRQRPRPVAHVPRRALPRAPPSARVRLADPPFLSRACPSSGPQRRAPSSSSSPPQE